MQAIKTDVLTILHFNDCYNIQERAQEPVGGVARFHTAVHSFDKLNPLVLFSGDLYAPATCNYYLRTCISNTLPSKQNLRWQTND